ncbi:helicase-related protein [Treponema parvum]|uniref:helicase-related protein n=1 Tax=Treponema parvum TaxID=138851 RepID=UPI001AEBBEF6|nr:ATP-dependent RNA helicase [Treponema parvum]QTQ15884.1 ATP-dependent RNA helicase [Treponema parvum]
MAINIRQDYTKLPVYAQKQRILDTLAQNQVIVVQSPTGSGKTTQIPVILHEAGYSSNGMIAVTQPRRIAALSVSEFIAKQLNTKFPGLVGYKMRFEDKTDNTTLIKIMTDGILLQEMKLDPWLSKYSVIMVDEAHERSLNIDFVLGLLKRILTERKDFKVVVSSATMNAEAFSNYFDGCPIVTIDTITYPVTIVYDPPAIPASTLTLTATEALLEKISVIIDRILANRSGGDILIFLPGEKVIKDCMQKLYHSPFKNKIHIIPLYGRLPKEDQEKVFENAPFGKKKVVISTNIAETSVTIAGITSVIDSGLAKLNYYSPKTFTSSLQETPVSKASCNQRRGRAGRTGEGTCYRLYPRKDFDTRETYTLEEIYRTDLSEVVLRMAELGITDFESFDFISPPGKEGIIGAVETLNMLKALDGDNTLSPVGKLMVQFPLEPRISRIIVESLMYYPDVTEQVLVAAAFLSAQSPFVLPPGQEMDARQAHHAFRDIQGDFVTYLKVYSLYTAQNKSDREKFCEKHFLDAKVMAEIENIDLQLTQIVSDMGFPVSSSGSLDDYLCCIGAGMIQFICIRDGKENYRSLTAEHITIHPGSCMFRKDPLYIVAGEIVRTSRMFAMSVSPLTSALLKRIGQDLEEKLSGIRKRRVRSEDREAAKGKSFEVMQSAIAGSANSRRHNKTEKDEDIVRFGGKSFSLQKIKGKKTLFLPWDVFKFAAKAEQDKNLLKQIYGLRGKIVFGNGYELLSGEKMELIFKLAKALDLTPVDEGRQWNRKFNININEDGGITKLTQTLDYVLKVTAAKTKSKEMGFIGLFTDGNGTYWFKVSRGFSTALNESLSSLEVLIDEINSGGDVLKLSDSQKEKINMLYRSLSDLYD